MAAREETIVPVIRTKLHRMPVAADFVVREALYRTLEAGRDRPLTLVSAPAGYGKSTLVAHWLETSDCPSAWLSLDAADSDIRVFLGYVVAAIRTVFPRACEALLRELVAHDLPPGSVLAGCLSNDLEALDKSFVLVLDDYHHIDNLTVHDLLDALLEHPPRSLHLVIISRRDPALSLGALRAHNWLTEIRMRDLQFTRCETEAFLDQATGHTVDGAALTRLHESMEGWAVGLRLAALALRHRSDVDAFVDEFGGDARQVKEYLVGEVLSHEPSEVHDWLCKTSLLSRFCAPLCEAVCTARGEEEGALSGSTFIEGLERSGLFGVSLDERQQWYRYHHLFQELLYRRLEAQLAPEEIAGLHRRAAAWFEAQGLLEEAIDHVLQGSGAVEAGRLMVRHRSDILNGEQWHRIARWLRQLPAEVVEDAPELLTLKVWYLQNQGRHDEAYSHLDRVEELLSSEPRASASTEWIQGTIDTFRGRRHFSMGQGDRAVKCAEQALKRLPPECLSERGYALLVLCAALRTTGELERARKVIYDALADTSLPLGTFQCRMLWTLCQSYWATADLPSLRLTAKQCFELGEELGLAESAQLGRYFMGIAQYHQNELSNAETSLVPVVESRRVPSLQFFAESAFALASVYEAKGRADKATESIESVCEYLLSVRNATLLQRAQAYQADLALRQGHTTAAVNWGQRFDAELNHPYQFNDPQITLAKVLIAQGSAESLERAADLLIRLETFLTRNHNTRFLIEVLALQALFRDSQGDESAAQNRLRRAVSLAQPGGSIRLFVDLGPGLVPLLNRLDLDEEGLGYVGRILAAYKGDGEAHAGQLRGRPESGPGSAGRPSLPDALTARELEILGMLGHRLSNKEISDRLCIAPATVKRHTENIYEKLGVHGRREAVAKAQGLAILSQA